jgi:hypothetical protein
MAARSSAPFPRDHARAREIADVTTDRVFLRLGPNGALGADEHQWILYRSGNSSTRRSSSWPDASGRRGSSCPREGRAALDALADDFSTRSANPTWKGTPLASEAPTPSPLVLQAPGALPAAGVTLRRSAMPRPMSSLRSEVDSREMAYQASPARARSCCCPRFAPAAPRIAPARHRRGGRARGGAAAGRLLDVLPKLYSNLSLGGMILVDDCLENNLWDGSFAAYSKFVAEADLEANIVL